MALGLGILRLDPAAFWSMTLPEFTAAANAVLGPRANHPLPTRGDLARLMAEFPDHSKDPRGPLWPTPIPMPH